MTTQFDSSASLELNNNAVPDNFIIRTMQDDLDALQNNPAPKTEVAAENISPEKKPFVFDSPKTPQPEKVPLPQKSSPFTNTTELTEVSTQPQIPSGKQPPNLKFVFSLVTILVVCVLGLGGYYFWTMRTPTPIATVPEPTPSAPQIQPEETQPVAVTPQETEKYSAEKPNYLSLDLATLSPDEIKSSIIKVADELGSLPTTSKVYEFLVVDANNNPVSFPIFATAANFKLNPNILNKLGDNFSLFLYNDNGNERLAVLVEMLDKKAVASEMLKQEKSLVTDVSFLFLASTPEIKTGSFKESTYNNFSIRYFNVSTTSNLSVDYSVTSEQLVIGTSKNTTRAVMDKLSLYKTQPINSIQDQQTAPTNTLPSKETAAATVQ